jgi:hypothetical protein
MDYMDVFRQGDGSGGDAANIVLGEWWDVDQQGRATCGLLNLLHDFSLEPRFKGVIISSMH